MKKILLGANIALIVMFIIAIINMTLTGKSMSTHDLSISVSYIFIWMLLTNINEILTSIRNRLK